MPQINKPTDYFNTKLYTGDGNSTQAITGVGFQPDYIWIKSRGTTDGHVNMDSVRGFTSSTKLCSYTNAAENGSSAVGTYEGYGYVSAVGSDGFTVNKGTGSGGQVNTSSTNYASWNWLAGGTPSSNTDGTITSSVSANTTSGFSIGTYSGNGTSDATIGHGLSSIPEMIIVKRRTGADNWQVYWNTGTERNGFLNLTNAFNTPAATAQWGTNEPTSSVFYVGNDNSNNASSNDYVFYAFHSVKGYSKFGEYTGNGNADGTFIYTGMRSAFVMVKRTSATDNWEIFDSKRNTFNETDKFLRANTTEAEATTAGHEIDILSNGFKTRGTSGNINGSGQTYIYMCFAENPLVGTNNIPATAR